MSADVMGGGKSGRAMGARDQGGGARVEWSGWSVCEGNTGDQKRAGRVGEGSGTVIAEL